MAGTNAALFTLVVAGFGSAFALGSVAVSAVPPVWVASIRAGVGCAIFLGLVTATGRRIGVAPRDLAVYALVRATTGAVPFFLLAWGQQSVPSSLAGVLFTPVPLMTVFLSWGAFGGPRPSVLRASAAALGLAGVAVAFPEAGAVGTAQLAGAAAILAAAVSYAVGGLILQRMGAYDPFALMAGQFALVAVVLTVAAGAAAPTPAFTAHLLAALALGATGSALPLICFLMLLRRTDAVIASSVTFFIPFVAVGLGIALLGEAPTRSLFLGFVICAAGSALVLRPNHRQPETAP